MIFLEYCSIKVQLELEKEKLFSTYPTFIFHSVLGKELKKLTCLFKNRDCSECSIKYTCPYSVFFVTPIEKNNKVLEGRDKAPHPYIISTDNLVNKKVKDLTLTFTIFGESIRQFPYLYYSLLKAGDKGIFKDRIKYKVKSVDVNGRNVLQNDGNLDMDFPHENWIFSGSNAEREKYEINISFISPLRLKNKGKFLSDISFNDVIDASIRRVELLTGFYGNYENLFSENLNYHFELKDKDIKWVDLNYYSSRQKERLKLGGIVGEIKGEGIFDNKILSLLEAAELFHIGKNPSFGLGMVRVRQKDNLI